MATTDKIRQVLEEALEPRNIGIIDDSANHKGHAGWRQSGETHFNISITSEKFNGMGLVQRHRLVLDILRPLMAESGLHAISISAKTPAETA